MANTLPVLDLFGIDKHDLQVHIKQRLSISSLNLILKAEKKIPQKEMRDESQLPMWAVFHHHHLSSVLVPSEGQEGKTWTPCGAPQWSFAMEPIIWAVAKKTYPEIWRKSSQVHTKLSSNPENTWPFVTAPREVLM